MGLDAWAKGKAKSVRETYFHHPFEIWEGTRGQGKNPIPVNGKGHVRSWTMS